jgi:predicted regulator of Ras-like GTPase activity (Roadblock/LC7/MglB family)
VDDARSLLTALASTAGVTVAVVMDRDGFVIDWAGETGVDAEEIAAVTSSLLESSERIGSDLGRGAVRSVILEFEEGAALIMGTGGTTRLAVVLRDPADAAAARSLVREGMSALERV